MLEQGVRRYLVCSAVGGVQPAHSDMTHALTSCSAVHNLAAALHSLSEGEAGLLGYLARCASTLKDGVPEAFRGASSSPSHAQHSLRQLPTPQHLLTLMRALCRGRTPVGRPLYDPQYALRLATERGKPRAAVKLLCELGGCGAEWVR